MMMIVMIMIMFYWRLLVVESFLSHVTQLSVYLEMSSDFEDYDKPPAPPVRLTSTKYAFVVY